VGLDFSTLVYLPAFDLFARPITVTPVASQPGQPAYSARGIYTTTDRNVLAEDGSIFIDQATILDIRESEFSILPMQEDQVSIPADGNVPDEGTFEIVKAANNGGGETTLVIRKIATPVP
jgi:hypothetical protein